MPVTHYENLSKEVKHLFKLDTPGSSYVIGIVDAEGVVGHLYYGKRLKDHHLENQLRIHEMPYLPSHNDRDRSSFFDAFPMEYPTHGLGDFRQDCFKIRTKNGNSGVGLTYKDYEITKGKPALKDLPATFCGEEEASTLTLICEDKTTGLEYRLCYSVFEDLSCTVSSGDPTGLEMAKSFQSRLPENQMKIRTEDGIMMLSKAENGRFDIIVMSKEFFDKNSAEAIAEKANALLIRVKEIPRDS